MSSKNQPRIGGKVRRLRRQRQISQAALATAIGISASYLNLIEHNRRQVTVSLLLKLAGYFGIEAGELAQSDDSQISGDLMEIFGDDIFADADVTNQDIYDLAANNPAIARATLLLFDKYQDMHTGKIAGEEKGSENAVKSNGSSHHQATDAISDFLQENANHFPSLEEAAERVLNDINNASDDFETGLRSYLRNVFGLEWRSASLPGGIASSLGANGCILEMSNILPVQTALFSAARHTGLLAAKNQIEAIIDASTLPRPENDKISPDFLNDTAANNDKKTTDAPALANNVLASYFAAALIMPYKPFLKACFEHRYDVERIARQFNASFEQVCHRMTTLQRPGATGLPLHLVRTDIAGNISKRFSMSGIHIPRHSGACPRWNVYGAFLQPGRINVQLSQMPDGEIYFCIARSFEKGGYRHNAQRRHFSIGLGCHISHADRMIYSDGIDLSNTTQVVPIGVGCRICPRMTCEQRAQPPANHRFEIDPAQRPQNLYGRI
ncbi:MAG: short-chain fatty acyl-CoA regulator family protein [Devosiaceae bacterium]|nr:short-chain fatty acyl-CoA regulator family protein [Devosiaceae bacterium]